MIPRGPRALQTTHRPPQRHLIISGPSKSKSLYDLLKGRERWIESQISLETQIMDFHSWNDEDELVQIQLSAGLANSRCYLRRAKREVINLEISILR